jgi:hypothetical protein
MSLKNPVTPPGIDPWTVRLVAQRLKHYATPGPMNSSILNYYSLLSKTLFQMRHAGGQNGIHSRHKAWTNASRDSEHQLCKAAFGTNRKVHVIRNIVNRILIYITKAHNLNKGKIQNCTDQSKRTAR